jgi:uroporphyrinogen decarboxylase
MNKRQIVIDTINHKRREVIPFQMDLSHDLKNRLINEFKDSDFERKLGNYMVMERNESFVKVDEHRERDMFGVVWCKDQEGDFGTVDEYLLKEPVLEGYDFPKPAEELIREKCERLVSQSNKDLFKLYIIGFSLFERAWSLRGMENTLTDFILEPEFIEELLDRIVEYNMAVMDIVMEYPIDAIFFGDDWGQQKGLIMGPVFWRQFIKPRLAKMYRHAKEKGFYICQHSCGDIFEVFPDLIEIGLDIYNTFQPEIYDVESIKKEFGNQLAFYGGISTQHVLPHGTPEQVKAEVKRMMKIMGENGGYIVAPTHAATNDISTENILAFLDVVQAQ